MQEARNVVSSPRWQNPVDVASAPQAATVEEKREQAQEPASEPVSAASERVDAPAKSPDDTAPIETAKAAHDDTDNSEAARDEIADQDTARDEEAMAPMPVPAHASYEPPANLLRAPLLTITTACALAAAAWSYTTLEDTRARLANVSDAKATLERALTDAKAKLATAEKTVADVKAAITAASAAPSAAAGKATGTK